MSEKQPLRPEIAWLLRDQSFVLWQFDQHVRRYDELQGVEAQN